jgi:diguanylate cyclase (GGDEF)-like protein/PAS domain S-box-containing protein
MNRLTWRTLAATGTLVVLVAAAVSQLAVAIAFQLAAGISVLSLFVGLRRFQPGKPSAWLGYLIGAGFFFLSYGLRLLIPSFGAQPSGEPTPADFIDMLGFLGCIVSTHRIGQVRDADKDPTTVLDALILTGGVGAIVWVGVLIPYVQDHDLSVAGRTLGVVLGVLTIWLVFAAFRLILGPAVKSASSSCVALAAVFGMASQAVASFGQGAEGRVVMTCGALALIFLGTAGLHPSMVRTTAPVRRGISQMTARRITAMTLAVLIAPMILLGRQSGASDFVFDSGLILSWVVITVLVMVRLVGLVRARERVASTERALSRAAASLVSAMDRDETYRSSLTALAELAGPDSRGLRTSVVLNEDGAWHTVCSWGFAAESAQDRPVDGDLLEALFTDSSVVQINDTIAIDSPVAGRCSMAFAPLLSHGQLRGALLVATNKPLASVVLDAMGSLASDVSLAIEAVGLSEDLHRRRSEHRFRALVENSPDVILVISDEMVTAVSPAAERLLGVSQSAWTQFLNKVHEDDTDKVRELVGNAEVASHVARHVEFRLIESIGNERWFEAAASNLIDEPEVNGIVLNASDITDRKLAERENELAQARFRSLVQHSSDLTIVLNHEGIVTYVTASVESMLGYQAEDLLRTDLSAIVHTQDQRAIGELAGLLVGGESAPRHVELRVRRADDRWMTLDVTLTDLRHDPAVNGLVMNAHDITERKALEHDLRHKVLHDDLTGIPNRVLFRDRVEHAIRSRNARPDGVSAVLFIDVDDFKTVNDGLGHDVGDEFLKVIAFRLEQFVRSSDTAARLGGDEFGVLFEELNTIDDVLNAAQRLLAVVNQPFEFGRREIAVSASIGVALIENDVTSDVLLRNADVAMYHAKHSGKSRIKLFDDSLYETAFERLELKSDLAYALERNELYLNYQPLISIATGQLVGFEALMRWTHPTRGFVSPATFIPLAEETGMIVPIGQWALEEAIGQLATWRAELGCEVGMSVNVSPRQLQEEGLVEAVGSIISANDIDPKWVTLELTESAGLDDVTKRNRLIGLRNLGCEIAADDFGTGFATYAALQQLPFTNVKIDRSLITGLSSNDGKAHAQVRSIIQMGHALGFTITAEGIEESRQADALVTLGADKAQGYLFGKPMSAADAAERIVRIVPAN